MKLRGTPRVVSPKRSRYIPPLALNSAERPDLVRARTLRTQQRDKCQCKVLFYLNPVCGNTDWIPLGLIDALRRLIN